MDFDLSKISLKQLAEYIQRDPISWRGISLLYAGTKNEQEAKSLREVAAKDKGALLFEQGGLYILLGAENVPKLDNIIVWVRCIASERKLVCDALSKVASYKRPVEKQSLPYSILVVEDEPLLNKMMTQHLEQYGIVTTTNNYREAVANYMVQTPHLVFLDINYRGDDMNGFDVLKSLLIYNATAFIVMVSGDGDIRVRLQAFALGAQGFIAKPFSADDFQRYLVQSGMEA